MKGSRSSELRKLTDREQKLLYVLALIALVSTTALFFWVKMEEVRSLRLKTAALESQAKKFHERLPDAMILLSRKEYLTKAITREERYYYTKMDTDPYRFGIAVRKSLLANKLEIQRYRTIEMKNRVCLEFSLSGSAFDLMNFLVTASTVDKHWFIPFLSIDAKRGDGSISSILRIHYETLDSSDR
jgi:hypothetical protein